MNKLIQRTVICLLLLTLLASAIVPAFAAEAVQSLTISNEEEFLTFAQSCMLDTYSTGMTVRLTADLDLSGLDFDGIPIFSGVFDGTNHTVSGLNLTAKGSTQGLFRYLTADACVRNLNVEGAVTPEGSRCAIGGIAGSNAGQIQNCTFRGEVSGSDGVGGITGTNQVSGLIEGCKTWGNLHGNHFVGGMAGQNFGLIRSCENAAGINMTASENDVSVSDISTSTITGTESADTVTDVGGIAGTSTGMIRGCTNRGTVGYQHMGYNIGGIAGSQRGFITECINSGDIYGRKEIAGIVGQVEPVSKIEYTEDTLQILRQQLSVTADLASQASSNVHNHAADLSNQMASLRGQAQTAADAVSQLLPSQDAPHFPDLDTIAAAKNTLSSCMSAMQGTISSMQSSAKSGINNATDDIQAITSQINAISATIGNAAENLGATVTDISDLDTPDDLTGKVQLCKNDGPISGDLNVGGITGAISWENDLDPEDDFQLISGSQSLKFDSQLRAVITQCENQGVITAKKRNAGGIVGSLSMGLVSDSVNVGAVDASSAENIGGITGRSTGFIRRCSAKCQLSGLNNVGGIAGQASVVTDCRSIVAIADGGEKLGSVLGSCIDDSTDSSIAGNFYLSLDQAPGAIDGINYAGAAEALPMADFMALDDLPAAFSQAHLTFQYENGDKKQITVPVGGAVNPDALPAVPEKDGFLSCWDPLDQIDLEHVCFDITLQPAYQPCQSVISSQQLRANGKPIVLAEGQFASSTGLQLQAAPDLPVLGGGMTALECWLIPAVSEGKTVYHLALPEQLTPNSAMILLQTADGSWSEPAFSQDGSYLVFSADSSDQAFCLVRTNDAEKAQVIGIAVGLLIVIALITLIFVLRRRKKKSKQ